jgi:hypothetical protein
MSELSTGAIWGAVVLAALLSIQLYIVMHDESSPIEWWHFISSPGKDGKQYADMTKLGQSAGVFLCVASVFIFASRKDVGATGFSLVLGVALAYLGGGQAYQTHIRGTQNPQKEVEK